MSTIEKRDEAIDLARYKQAAEEIETGNRDDALWYKAFAEGGGEDKATKATYIRLRVEQLRRADVAASAVRVTAMQPAQQAPRDITTQAVNPNGSNNLYDILGISRTASDAQINAAYQLLKWELDAQENKDAATKNKLLSIQHAQRVLLDPARRSAYDAKITAETAQPEKSQQGKSTDSSSTSTSEPLSNHDLYAAYLGEKNQDYYLNKFEEFDRRGGGIHASFNLNAILFFGLWTLYRKMYSWFLISVMAFLLLSKALPNISFLYFILMGVFADTLYHKHVKKKIAEAKIIARNDNELIESLRRKGGIHAWVIWAVLATFIIGIIAAIIIPAMTGKNKYQAAVEQPAVQPPAGNQPSVESAKTMLVGRWTCKTETGESAGTAYATEYKSDFTSGTYEKWEFLPDGTLWVQGTLYYGDKDQYSLAYSEVYKLNWISATEFAKSKDIGPQATGNRDGAARCFKSTSF